MAIKPRLTFKAGTVSRFIQRHGIQATWQPIDIPAKDYWVRLSKPNEKIMEFSARLRRPDVEEALLWPASMAYDWELAEGTPSGLARLYGLDETKVGDIYADYEEMYLELLDFLGSRAYMELMALLYDEEREAVARAESEAEG